MTFTNTKCRVVSTVHGIIVPTGRRLQLRFDTRPIIAVKRKSSQGPETVFIGIIVSPEAISIAAVTKPASGSAKLAVE